MTELENAKLNDEELDQVVGEAATIWQMTAGF